MAMAMAMTAAAGCGAELPASAVEAQLRAYFGSREIEPQQVRCPGELQREPGQTMVCDATIDGQVIPVVAEVADEDGTLTLRPRHATLVTARVEPEIAQTLRAQGYAVSEVRCRGQVWVAAPQAQHRCEITVDDGRRYAWSAVFSGEGSEHRARVTPIDGGPS